MVQEKAKSNKDWSKYEGFYCKVLYQDGVEKDGKTPHYSTKKGYVDKVTKTHIIVKIGKTKYTGLKLLEVLRVDMEEDTGNG